MLIVHAILAAIAVAALVFGPRSPAATLVALAAAGVDLALRAAVPRRGDRRQRRLDRGAAGQPDEPRRDGPPRPRAADLRRPHADPRPCRRGPRRGRGRPLRAARAPGADRDATGRWHPALAGRAPRRALA